MYICTILTSINLFFLMCLQNWAQWATIFSGFSTPIITGITIYFLYKAFTKQNEANIINKESHLKLRFENNYDRTSKQIIDFENMLNEYYNTHQKPFFVYSQKSGIEKYIDSMKFTQEPENYLLSYCFNNIYYILTQFAFTLDDIETNNFNSSLKDYCTKNLIVLYFNKLYFPLSQLKELYFNGNLYFESTEISKTKKLNELILKMIKIHDKFDYLCSQSELFQTTSSPL